MLPVVPRGTIIRGPALAAIPVPLLRVFASSPRRSRRATRMEQETEAGSANRAPCAPFDATSDVGMALLPEATQRMAQLPHSGRKTTCPVGAAASASSSASCGASSYASFFGVSLQVIPCLRFLSDLPDCTTRFGKAVSDLPDPAIGLRCRSGSSQGASLELPP